MVSYRGPRGQRRIPPARWRAPADPYGTAHQKIRAALLTRLAATGPWPCPLCGQAMFAWMGRALHLHHSNPAAKLLGLPGDQLAHAACNIRDGGRLGAVITNTGGRAAVPMVTSRRW